MGFTWQLQDAKNKFSEVVDKAIEVGPQEITRHGKKTAVVLSIRDYQKLKLKHWSLVDFFRNSPLNGLTFERQKDLPRSVSLYIHSIAADLSQK
jgi:prevent-host-death family protein